MTPLIMFLEESKRIKNPVVMEIGTRRVNPDLCTKHDSWIPHAAQFVGVDYVAGVDVDLVADVHQLATVVGKEQADIIITCSTFEHVKYPHRAAHEILKTLRIGGLLLLHTHQSWPIHSFPYDYFRFSREGLAGLVGTKMGFETISVDYEFPARIHSEREPQLKDFDAFLNVSLFGRKINTTPQDYIYELD